MEIKLIISKINKEDFSPLLFWLPQLIFSMGQSTTHQSSMPLITDRSLSFLAESTHRSSNEPIQSATKTVTVTSIEELNLLKEMFDFRLKNRNYLTHWYGFEVIDANSQNLFSKLICNALFSSIKVHFHYEKISARFTDIYQIPIEHGLNLLSHCLKAYSLLYDEFGYFTPQARQINRQGDEWKVWINENIFALKSKYKKQSTQNQVSKQKFLQQVIHLFDALRDYQEPEFSYSVFIYVQVTSTSFLPSFSLNQILESINETLQNANSVKKHQHRTSLRRVTLTSNSTVRRLECNTVISFDEKANEETLPKFNKKKDKNLKKYLPSSRSMKNSHKQNMKHGFVKMKCQTKRQSLHHGQGNSSRQYNSGQRSLGEQNHELSKFRRVSSKIICGTPNKDLPEPTLNHQHRKNKLSASKLSNCTGQTKNMKPLQILSNKLNMQISSRNGSFLKKQRLCTMDFTNNGPGYFQPEICEQTIKITDNSEINSDSERIDYMNNKFDKAFLSSDRTDQNQESEKLGPVQIISKNPTSQNSPSIAHRTRECGQETMKLLKEYLMVHSKRQHKRSLINQACLETQNNIKTQNKIKYCWSQEFDSEFFSLESKSPSKPEFKSEHLKTVEKECVPERSQEDETINRDIQKKKTVKISFKDGASLFGYNQKDSDAIWGRSNLGNQSEPNGASLGKMPIFKSEGFKSLLGYNRLNTLKSIKQIQVDYPIDEEILNDMNKIFTKHRFAKSTKLTQLQDQ